MLYAVAFERWDRPAREAKMDDEFAAVEQDPRFPSGAWTGFFLQYWLPGRHDTNLRMSCRDGQLTGIGRDWVGAYSISGTYDLATGQCEWIKKYKGKHSVSYRGVNDGHGIWGVWEIRQLAGLYVDRGGFHIWPEGTNVSEASQQTEQAVLQVMRKEFGSRLSLMLRLLLIHGTIVALAVVILALIWWNWRF
jgi:hypothetical protein